MGYSCCKNCKKIPDDEVEDPAKNDIKPTPEDDGNRDSSPNHFGHEAYESDNRMVFHHIDVFTHEGENENTANNSLMVRSFSNNSHVFGLSSTIDEGGSFMDYSDLSVEKHKNFNEDYLSMSSNSILTDNSKLNVIQSNKDLDNLTNVLLSQNYLIFYFELDYFVLWNSEYLKGVYPDGNVFFTMKINDDMDTFERIYLHKPDERQVRPEDKKKFKPMLRKEDFRYKCHRVVKFIRQKEFENKRPYKLTTEICLYTNGKFFPLSEENLFFYANTDTEMHKYQFYPNVNTKFSNKKIGNLHFCVIFKSDRVPSLNENTYNRYLSIFGKRDKLMTYNEDSAMPLKYYNITNSPIRTKGCDGKNFDSLKSLNDIESVLKEKNVNIEKLLELLSSGTVIYKYELYDVLNKLCGVLSKMDFDEDKLHMFKERLNKLMEDFRDNKDSWDKVLIPLLFFILRRTFFKAAKAQMKVEGKSLKASTSKVEISEKYFPRHIEILINLFQISFHFISKDIPHEITLSALNYMCKNIEDNYPMGNFGLGSKKTSSEEYFINYIIVKRKYLDMCDLLLYFSDNPSCVQPITTILLKVLKTKGMDTLDLVSTIKQDKFKQVFKEIINTHDCNAVIMSNIICIFYQLTDVLEIEEIFQVVSLTKLREIFLTFRYSFDLLHESVIYFIRAFLVKKSTSQSLSSSSMRQGGNILDSSAYSEIIVIFSYAIQYIKSKICTIADVEKLIKSLYVLLTHLYTICNIINNINEKNAAKVFQACIEKKMADYLIDCLTTINERGGFTKIDHFVEKLDVFSINTKMIIFRTLLHCLTLFENLKSINPQGIGRASLMKLYNLIKTLEDCDAIYNPNEILKQAERLNKPVDDNVKNNLKNLYEYYSRYKAKLPAFAEYLKEQLITKK